MNIIDVGAGKFQYYEEWLSRYPTLRIFCIEPHPTLFTKLSSQLQFKEPAQKRLFLLNYIIDSVSNTLSEISERKENFYLNNDPNTSSTLLLDSRGISKWKYPVGRKKLCTQNVIEISAQSISDLIEKYKIYYIDLLNIDVQGNSMAVLQGIRGDYFNKIKQITIKVHNTDFNLYQNQTTRDQIESFLKMRFFTCNPKIQSVSLSQEVIITFFNDIIKNKGGFFFFCN